MSFPRKRDFISIIGDSTSNSSTTLSALQFNVLADGLFGLRSDRGDFSRLSEGVHEWEYRRQLILHEITQYDADVVCIQELDHCKLLQLYQSPM